jgi:hypothetical protein
MTKNLVPSEMVVAYALKSSFFDFLLDTDSEPELKKFIRNQAQPDKMSGVAAAA